MRNLQIVLALIGAGLIGLMTAVALRDSGNTVKLDSGVALQQPREIPAFELIDHNGDRFTAADLRGQWHLVFAGFTNCPDVCPNTLGMLKAAEDQLRGSATNLRTLFLSVDPKRDTTQKLASYVTYFSEDFVGLTGAREQIDTVCENLGLAYRIGDAEGTTYEVDHSAAVVVIDPQGRIAGYLTPPHSLDTLVADIRRLITV